MAMPLPNARNQYLKTQVETATKEQLVVMLFDGIIRFTEQARKAIENKEIEESHHALMRAQAIVMELICTVDKDKGGDIAGNMMGLHAYAFNCLILCNMKKDVSKIDEVQNIYRQLREGWVGAMESLGIGATKAPAAAPASVPPKPAAPAASQSQSQAARPTPPAPNGEHGSAGGVLAAATRPAPAARTGYPAPAAAVVSVAAPAKPMVSPRQAAMLSAYQANRSIA